MNDSEVATAFEEQFLSEDPSSMAFCDEYELTPWFDEWLPDAQPILEAGCGMGKWVGWFHQRGWTSVGVDWSERLCLHAMGLFPACEFVCADLRELPFEDGAFHSIVSLGAIEHVAEGPEDTLREFRRVLAAGGVLIVTVPWAGGMRRVVRTVTVGARWAKSFSWLRMLANKVPLVGVSYRTAVRSTRRLWSRDLACGDGGWFFLQYYFSKRQMRSFLRAAGFRVIREEVLFANDGLVQTLGRIAGKYQAGRPELTRIGRTVRRYAGTRNTGHMLCYVAAAADAVGHDESRHQ